MAIETSEAKMTRELQEALEKAAGLSEDQQRLIASAVLLHVEVVRNDDDHPRQIFEDSQNSFIETDRGIPVFRVPENAPIMTSADVARALHDEL